MIQFVVYASVTVTACIAAAPASWVAVVFTLIWIDVVVEVSPVMSPLFPAVTAKSSLMATVLQLNKALGLSASQMGVAGKDQEARNKAERTARKVIEEVTDDLI